MSDADSDAKHDTNRITVWLNTALLDRVDDRVDWRYESRSQWLREATQYRMAVEDELARQGIAWPEATEDRERLLRDIAIAGVDAIADERTD